MRCLKFRWDEALTRFGRTGALLIHRFEADHDEEAHELIQSGDIAQYISRWNLKGRGPDGKEVQMRGTSSDILRRQAEDGGLSGSTTLGAPLPWAGRSEPAYTVGPG